MSANSANPLRINTSHSIPKLASGVAIDSDMTMIRKLILFAVLTIIDGLFTNANPVKISRRFLPVKNLEGQKSIRLELHRAPHSRPDYGIDQVLELDQQRNEMVQFKLDPNRPVASVIERGMGAYYVQMGFGKPAQFFTLIMDTGSDFTWIQCQPCQSCYAQRGPIFDPSKSGTYRPISCDDPSCSRVTHKCNNGSLPSNSSWVPSSPDSVSVSQPDSPISSPISMDSSPIPANSPDSSPVSANSSIPTNSGNFSECIYGYGYQDGSITTGSVSSEVLTLKSSKSDDFELKNFVFGCGRLNFGTFRVAAGIMGLARSPLALQAQMGGGLGRRFAYCLQSAKINRTSSLVLGDSGDPSGLLYTPIAFRSGKASLFYFVRIHGISLGSVRLQGLTPSSFADPNGNSLTVLDSGTTLTYLPRAAVDLVKSHLLNSSSISSTDPVDGLSFCFNTSVTPSNLPPLTLHFEGADYNMPPQNYLLDVGNHTQCLAIVPSEGLFFVGNIAQQNFYILHDVENSRIGFKQMDCGLI